MKVLLVAFFVLYTICGTSANPKTLCYDSTTNFYIRADTTKALSDKCEARYCDPKSMQVQPIYCGLVAAYGSKDRPCTVTVEDLTQSYPNCCPKLVCPK